MSIILDVAIGIVFLYLLLALIATTTQELIATVLRLRAKNLYDAIAGMLKGEIAQGGVQKPIVEALYQHPLIKNLYREEPRFVDGVLVNKSALPSYIPSKTFAIALLDVLRGDSSASKAIGAREVLLQAASTVDRIEHNDELKRVLTLVIGNAQVLADKVDAEATRVSSGIETWFNDRMARASGWYKRRAQWIALTISFVITASFNADTFHVAGSLWRDGALRESIAAAAQAYASEREGSPPDARSATPPAAARFAAASESDSEASADDVLTDAERLRKDIKRVRDASFPIGWDRELPSPLEQPGRSALLLIGWIVTALAVSLGSNFWFDVLNKALQLRGGGPRVSAATGRVEKDDS
jgi:hypothetical protein